MLFVSFFIGNINAEQIKDIKINGLQRIEPGVVFDSLPFEIGDSLEELNQAEIINLIYKTGQFRDVYTEFDEGVLEITVAEKPMIYSIEFNGNNILQTDKLREGIKQINLYEGAPFEKNKLSQLEKDLAKSYTSMGRYNVTVKASYKPLERNRVTILVDIDEGSLTRVSEINIVGATKFTNDDLLSLMETKTTNWLSWWEKDDRYSKSTLASDIEKIKDFYFNRGYLDFKILSNDVSISPNKRNLIINLNISEGDKYSFGDVKISGDLDEFSDQELKNLVVVKKSNIFNRSEVNSSSEALKNKFGEAGYAFANVNPISTVDKTTMSVSYDFFINKGNKVYVRNINFIGNARTKDKVLRREMRQFESSWYDESKVQRSKARLTRLQYFSSVDVETKDVSGTTDQIDLNVTVAERNTGKIMLGAGVSSAEGLMGSFNVSQTNFAGTGNTVALGISTGQINRTYSLSYTDPYYTDDGVSRGFSVYRRDMNTAKLRGIGTYNTYSYGAGVNFGIPLSETDFLSFGAKLDMTDLELTDRSPTMYKEYCTSNYAVSGNESCTANSFVFDAGIRKDTRDNVLAPTSGYLSTLSAEMSAPVLDMKYYKINANTEYYKPLTKTFTLKLHGGLGYGDTYDNENFPFFRNYFMGGVKTVRGYRTSSIGPKYLNATNNQWYTSGGQQSVQASAEVYFPVPGLKSQESFRMSTFFDAGGVFTDNDYSGSDTQYKQGEMRYSVGLGLMWNSPFGPLAVSIAEPLNDDSTDRIQRFQFGMGSTF